MQKLRLILPTLALVFAVTVLSASSSFAQDGEGLTSPSLLAQRIAERFGLNETEVQEVVDEIAAERFAEAQTRVEDRLSQLVTDGKLTEEQRQLILEKMDEWHQERAFDHEAMMDMTPTERRELMQQRRDEMQEHHDELMSWAQENGIDLSLFPLGEGRMGRHGMMSGLHEGSFSDHHGFGMRAN